MRHLLLRVVTVAALAAVTGCGAPPPPPGSVGGPDLLAGGALFKYRNGDAKTVYLVGDFNDWSPVADPMTDQNGDGQWSLYFPLEAGRYAYKFLVDGKSWIADPTNPNSEPDGFDGRNSIVVIPADQP